MSPSENRGRREEGGRIQSGTSLMKKPFTPRDAASMAAYSRRRVLSEVQYCIVAGGAGMRSSSAN